MFSSFTGVNKFGRRKRILLGGVISSGLTLKLTAATFANPSWPDQSGNGNDLVAYNNPVLTSGSPSYVTFVASSSHRAIGLTTGVIPTTQYSKTVWFYLNTMVDNNLVSSATGGHFMFLGGTNILYAGHTNVMPYAGAGAFGSTSTFTTNTWYHAAVTFSTSEGIKMYINGTLDASNAGFTTAHNGDGSTNVGVFGAGNFLNGRIGEVYCYNRVLTAGEILQNFNATRSTYGL